MQKINKEFCIPMKRSSTIVCLLASAIGVGSMASAGKALAQASTPSAPSAPSPAEAAGPSASPNVPASAKVAIINFQQAVAATNEGQRNFAQLRTKFEPKQAQLKAQNDEIDSLKKQLQDAGSSLSEPERESRLRTIDEKTKSLQRSAEDAQNEASGAMNDMYQQLAQKVYAVLDAYSNQNKFTVVLDTSAQQTPVLWANGSVDITKAIVEAYNAKSGVPPQPAATAPRPSTGTTPRSGGTTTRPSSPKTPQ
jgi:outer membrane protein